MSLPRTLVVCVGFVVLALGILRRSDAQIPDRPPAPVVAVTSNPDVAGSLTVVWGVQPLLSAERHFERLAEELVGRRLLSAGEVAVFVNVSTAQDRADANYVHVRQLSAPGAP